ncbi:hypothetical protein GCM10012275_15300 [Longimycelium tulufanense]|uniref:Uncharacterized protein n=1 Tax=Longimycelium tulufanense TaxID=907463 RepID=A0A8J3C9E5_9PSEU|nr:AAA family ATPase [Longimycelium tulufanense]GGM45173.1 hypothetical protein GCM10012275_15300 [Longimycelium tulufanense]
MVWTSLEEKGIRFLRGQLVLVAAGPGTGKSIMALNLALRGGVPALVFSADSDAWVQLTRSMAILCDRTIEEASQAILEDRIPGEDRERLARAPIRLDYDASPDTDDLEEAVESYEEVYGDFPHLIIVDNITNVRGGADDDDPFSGLESILDYLHSMARATNACVVALHHVTGPYVDSDKPIPLSGVKGQVTRVPELVLTLHGALNVSPVKNRSGKADPSGLTYAELEFVGERALVRDPSPTAGSPWSAPWGG